MAEAAVDLAVLVVVLAAKMVAPVTTVAMVESRYRCTSTCRCNGLEHCGVS